MHDIDGSELEAFESEAEEQEYSGEETFSEADETEYAAELVSVGNEAELEQFLGDLVKRVGSAIGSVIPPGALGTLKSALKSAAKKALPQLGSAVGGMFGGATGSRVGGALAAQAGKALGLELEGLSAEDREFECARQFVRFAADAARKLAEHPQPGAQAAVHAAVEAAQKHAPGLVSAVQRTAAGPAGHPATTGAGGGRWVRRGNKLIVFGV